MNRREFFGACAIVAVAAACKSNDAATADVHVSATDLIVADPDGVRYRARPEPVEQRPLRIGEEAVGPIEGGCQSAVPIDRSAPAISQQRESVAETDQQLGWRQRSQPGSGQLDGERKPVEMSAQLDEDRPVIGDEHGVGCGGSLDVRHDPH
jgi:hypothetical protein